MNRTFLKKLLRDIKGTPSRFISIVVIIAVGMAFYTGVRATSPDMKKSADYYFNSCNLMDFKLISTLGFTPDDIDEIINIDGAAKAQGSFSMDAVTEINNQPLVLNILSMPGADGINRLRIVSGRTAQKSNESVIEQRFLKENNLKIGDRIVLQSGNDKKIGGSLRNNEFVIVGTAFSPLFVSEQRQLSSIGNGEVKGFVYILPEVFKYDAYTEIYVSCRGELLKNSILNYKDYKAYADSMEQKLKRLGTVRRQVRYDEVLKAALKNINEAEQKLNCSKKKAYGEFADARKKIEDAQNRLEEGRKELQEKKMLFKMRSKDGEEQIYKGKRTIEEAQHQIDKKSKEIEFGKVQLGQGKIELDKNESRLNASKLQAAKSISEGIYKKLSDLRKSMDGGTLNPLTFIQYRFLKQAYEKDIYGKNFDSMYLSMKKDGILNVMRAFFDMEGLKKSFDDAENRLSAGRQKIEENERSIKEGEAELLKAKAEIDANKLRIEKQETELYRARQQGIEKFQKAEQEITNAQGEIDRNASKLKAEEESANRKFRDGEAEIKRARDKLAEIKEPEWYVLGRSCNIGYETYRQDSGRIDNIGRVFPVIFFLVSALVSLTAMTRMVQEKRAEIGIFKALGYSRWAIVSYFLIYCLSASLIGSLVGVCTGHMLFPPLIIKAYSSLYTIPDPIMPFDWKLSVEASLISVFFVASACTAAVLEEIRRLPASLLRPKQVKSGKSVMLERITPIWKRLSFVQKVTARNIFRYKPRLFMTLFGIAACTGLMITGFGLRGAITGAADRQFNTIYRYDIQGNLDKNIDGVQKDAMKQDMLEQPNIKSILFTQLTNISAGNGIIQNIDTSLVVPENIGELSQYINLAANGRAFEPGDEGAIITEKLSRLLNRKAGDHFKLKLSDSIFDVKIAAVSEQYIQHYIYMSPAYYERLTGKKPAYNSFYGFLKNAGRLSEDNIVQKLSSISGIGFVNLKNRIQVNSNKAMASVNSVVFLLIISAGVLAFVVIYNLTDINMNERKPELATIKLLGFYDNELASYIYRENVLLTIIGSAAGVGLGILMERYVIVTAETDILMFYRNINPVYFLYSVLLTVLFSLIVNMSMYKRFERIDMIEAMKRNE